MKKTYITPAVLVVELAEETALLAVSVSDIQVVNESANENEYGLGRENGFEDDW